MIKSPNKYNFSLKFKLKTPEINPEDYIDVLYDSGCDDAMVGIGKIGYISLDFTREASNAFEAVSSAIANIKEAIPDVLLVEATPDLGGISDIADLLNCSRQNIRQLVYSDLETPPPIHGGKSPIWHMAEVLSHFNATQRCIVIPELIDLTSVNRQVNLCRGIQYDELFQGLYPNSSIYLEKLKALVYLA